MPAFEKPKTIAELFSDPARTTKGAWARDVNGWYVHETSPDAICWCLLGACRLIYPYDKGMIRTLHDAIIAKHPAMDCGMLESGVVTLFNDTAPLSEVQELVAELGI